MSWTIGRATSTRSPATHGRRPKTDLGAERLAQDRRLRHRARRRQGRRRRPLSRQEVRQVAEGARRGYTKRRKSASRLMNLLRTGDRGNQQRRNTKRADRHCASQLRSHRKVPQCRPLRVGRSIHPAVDGSLSLLRRCVSRRRDTLGIANPGGTGGRKSFNRTADQSPRRTAIQATRSGEGRSARQSERSRGGFVRIPVIVISQSG